MLCYNFVRSWSKGLWLNLKFFVLFFILYGVGYYKVSFFCWGY